MTRPEAAGPIDIYARVSRKGDKQQRSTTGQAGTCRAVLAERELPAGEVFTDDGKSAWNPRVVRPAWDALMSRLESGESGGVIVFDLERFARRPADGERLITAAERGLIVLDSDAEFDLTTASGKKSFRDAMAAAAYYSDRLSDRVRRGNRAKAINGQVRRAAGWQDRPFGWDADGITQRPAEVAILREIAARFLKGETQDSIAADLNTRDITTTQGNPWTMPKIRELLLRERNRGNLVYRGVVVAELPGEPVLDPAMFDRIAAKYAARRPGRPYTRAYLATGAAVCAVCRVPLDGRPVQRRRPYPDGQVAREYRCMKRGGGCGTVHADQREADAAARELAIAILSDPRHAAQVEAAAARHEEEATALDSLIAEAEQTALQIGDRLGRGEITLGRHDAIIGPLDARLAMLRAKREALNGPPGPVPAAASQAQWAARWDAAEPAERRSLLAMALRGRVLAISRGGHITVTDPS